MIESDKKFQDAFDEFSLIPLEGKIKFIEALLFFFTLTGRAIWSDDELTDLEKLGAALFHVTDEKNWELYDFKKEIVEQYD